MKRYLYVSGILGAIALICAVLIALMNMLTKPIINSNNEKIMNETYSKIYVDYYSNEEVSFNKDDKNYIKSKVKAFDKDGNLLGYIYTTSGKNSYGEISLMIGITNFNVIDIEFLTNTESFASTVSSHVKSNYPSSNDAVIEINPYGKEELVDIGAISLSDIEEIDIKCGATFGATLVKSMVLACITEAKEGE